MTDRDELSGEAWSLIRRAMDTPQTDNYEAESAYRDAYASEAAGKVIALIRSDERRRVATALLDEARVFDSDFASERTWDSGIAVKLEDDVRLILGATGVIEPGENGDE